MLQTFRLENIFLFWRKHRVLGYGSIIVLFPLSLTDLAEGNYFRLKRILIE